MSQRNKWPHFGSTENYQGTAGQQQHCRLTRRVAGTYASKGRCGSRSFKATKGAANSSTIGKRLRQIRVRSLQSWRPHFQLSLMIGHEKPGFALAAPTRLHSASNHQALPQLANIARCPSRESASKPSTTVTCHGPNERMGYHRRRLHGWSSKSRTLDS